MQSHGTADFGVPMLLAGECCFVFKSVLRALIPPKPALTHALSQDLHTVVEGQLLSEASAKSVIRQLLQALQHMHAHGHSHNDVKLENVFVASEHVDGMLSVVLGDFGLARPSLQFCGPPLGTIAFMAPELLARRREHYETPYDGSKADIWAIGVLGVFCLTGAGVGLLDGAHVLDPSFTTSISPDAQGFLKYALTIDAAARPTAEALLSHAWMTDACSLSCAVGAASTVTSAASRPSAGSPGSDVHAAAATSDALRELHLGT